MNEEEKTVTETAAEASGEMSEKSEETKQTGKIPGEASGQSAGQPAKDSLRTAGQPSGKTSGETEKPAQQKRGWLRHFKEYDLGGILSVVLVCLFPCVYMWAVNAEEAGPASMLTFLGIFLVTACVILLLVLIFTRNLSRAALFTDAAMLFVMNYMIGEKAVQTVCPWMPGWVIAAGVILVLGALLFFLLKKKPDMRIPCVLVAIAFFAVCIVNVGVNIPKIYSSFTNTDTREDMPETGVVFEGEQPNVYYMIYDEYAGYENLLHYYDYDNAPFLDQLEELGFNVAKDSHNTEGVYTQICMPNLLNMDYVMSSDRRYAEHFQYLDNSYIVRMFHENGYTVNLANNLNYIGTTNVDHVLTTNQYKQDISWSLFRHSLYYKVEFVRNFMNSAFHLDTNHNFYNSVLNTFAAEKSCWEEAEDGATFTIGYVECPHSPLNIGRDGELLDYSKAYDWADPQVYLDHLEYTNSQILETVQNIIDHDPDALIILQSDHGCRYPIHQIQAEKSDWYDPETENEYMSNILNCVYYKGQTFDIEGETGINTLRAVFNQVLGSDLQMIEPVYDYKNYSALVAETE